MRITNLLVVCLAHFAYYTHANNQEFVHLARGYYHVSNGLQPSCQSQVFCNSEILHDVQLAHIYPDSKTFVDKKLKYSESDILKNYKVLKDRYNGSVPKEELIKFVDEHFMDGDELEVWIPPDFNESPSISNRIKDKSYKQWALGLNQVWKTLARKVKDDVRLHPDRYSLIWVPNGFVIPGGRFRELYYWDTYWIVKGMLLCDMSSTAKGVIDNILSFIETVGFMPNGGRVYYLNRSQPPMVTLMVESYYKATNDFEYVKKCMPILDNEFEFFSENRMVTFEKNGKSYTMARYYAPSRGPRPESYREDYESAEFFKTENQKQEFYTEMKSAAESGWDFSSRWFISGDGSYRSGNLTDIQTTSIIPVDLNCILHKNALLLSSWYSKMGDTTKAEKYRAIAENLVYSIQEVMWRPDLGAWFDWDMLNNKSREYFFVSNIVPLWTESYNMPKKAVASSVLGYLRDNHIIEADYTVNFNGTPTSLFNSSQQWDFPNAWPPLQAFIIQGLDRTNQKLAQQVSFRLAEVWLRSNYKSFAEKSMMFEKYDVLLAGETGDGGEYTPQTGFGWTNGVVFEFLNRWGDTLSNGINGCTTGYRYLCDFNRIRQQLMFWT